MKLKKAILILLLSVTVLSVSVVLYMSFSGSGKYKLLETAKQEIVQKNNAAARRLLQEAITKDSGFEEAILLLLTIEESEENQENTLHLLTALTRLNPLSADYAKRLDEAVIVSQNPNFIIENFGSRLKENSLSEEHAFYLAYSYLKRNDMDNFKKVFEKLKKTNSAYAQILEGLQFQKDGKFKDSLGYFESDFKTKDQSANASYGAAISYLSLNDLSNAQKLIKNIEGHRYLKAPLDVLKGQLYASQNELESALTHYLKASKMLQFNTELIAATAELAYRLKNKAALADLRESVLASTKQRIFLKNYIKALESFLKNETKESYKSLNASGAFKQRANALFLNLSLTQELGNTDDFIKTLQNILLLKLPADAQKIVAKDIEKTLLKNLGDRKKSGELAEYLLLFDENNIGALKILLRTMESSNKRDVIAKKIMTLNPQDDDAFLVYAVCCLRDGENENLIKSAKLRLTKKEDMFTNLFLAQALTASMLNEESVKYYKKALEISDYSLYASELSGEMFIEMNNEKELLDLVEKLSLKSANEKSLGLALAARFYRLKGDFDAAILKIKESIALNAQIPNLYVFLSDTYAAQKQSEKSIAALRDGLQKNKDDSNLKFKLALALGTSDKKENWNECEKILSELLKRDENSVVLLLNYSEILAQLNDSDGAMKFALKAFELDSESPETNFYLALRYGENGLYTKSIEKFRYAKRKSKRTDIDVYMKKVYEKAINSSKDNKEKRNYILDFKKNYHTEKTYDAVLKAIENEKN